MRQQSRLVQPLALILCGGALSVAQAQPDPNRVPIGVNPPEAQAPLVLRERLPGNLVVQEEQTPEQMREQNARAQLGDAGFTEKALQDAVVQFLKAQERARKPLREKAAKLSETSRPKLANEAQVSALVNELRAAIEVEKTRSEVALAALNAKISYRTKPRLEALLMLLGYIGDEPWYLRPPGNDPGRTELPIILDKRHQLRGDKVLKFKLDEGGRVDGFVLTQPVAPGVTERRTDQQPQVYDRLRTAPQAPAPLAVPEILIRPGIHAPGDLTPLIPHASPHAVVPEAKGGK